MVKDVSFIKKCPFSHRGLHNNIYPENSMGAFINSIKNNYGIELDVQLTKDKKAVVFHDEFLERMTGYKGIINNMTYNEICKLRLLNTDEKIPLLLDVLDIINNRVPVLIELKALGDAIYMSSEVYKIVKNYEGKFAIQSFNPRVLLWYKENANNIIRGQISFDYKDTVIKWYKKLFLRGMILNIKTKPDFVSYDIKSIQSQRVQLIRKKMPVITWTILDCKQYKKASKYADNIIFEGIDLNKC